MATPTPTATEVRSTSPSSTKAVTSPNHYEVTHGVEAMDVIEAVLKHLDLPAHQSYLLGNLLKYRLRAGHKDDLEQDIAKADEYKRRLDDIRKPKKPEPYEPGSMYAVNMSDLNMQLNGMWRRGAFGSDLIYNFS